MLCLASMPFINNGTASFFFFFFIFFYQVINFEMPESAAGYVHRIGRTGRAYSTGASVSLVSFYQAISCRIFQT